MGSALAYRSIPLQSAYCGAKHAVVGFTDSIRSELLHDGSNVHITVAHLPALNTPQFEWSRSRMPRHPQPVPPIFQPEVAAGAIVWAARHRRREVSVGLPTVVAIQGQKIAPGLADHYLAETGYESQQMEEPAPYDRPDNLFASAPGDYGAHERFDERARERSVRFWFNRHRSLVAMIGGGLTGLAIGAWNRRRSWHGGISNGWLDGHRPLVAFAKGGLAGALAAFAWKGRNPLTNCRDSCAAYSSRICSNDRRFWHFSCSRTRCFIPQNYFHEWKRNESISEVRINSLSDLIDAVTPAELDAKTGRRRGAENAAILLVSISIGLGHG